MTAEGNFVITIASLVNRKNQSIEAALGSGHFVFMDIPQNINVERAMLMRNLPEGVDTRNPHQPG